MVGLSFNVAKTPIRDIENGRRLTRFIIYSYSCFGRELFKLSLFFLLNFIRDFVWWFLVLFGMAKSKDISSSVATDDLFWVEERGPTSLIIIIIIIIIVIFLFYLLLLRFQHHVSGRWRQPFRVEREPVGVVSTRRQVRILLGRLVVSSSPLPLRLVATHRLCNNNAVFYNRRQPRN